jgi:hypothetical protein
VFGIVPDPFRHISVVRWGQFMKEFHSLPIKTRGLLFFCLSFSLDDQQPAATYATANRFTPQILPEIHIPFPDSTQVFNY